MYHMSSERPMNSHNSTVTELVPLRKSVYKMLFYWVFSSIEYSFTGLGRLLLITVLLFRLFKEVQLQLHKDNSSVRTRENIKEDKSVHKKAKTKMPFVDDPAPALSAGATAAGGNPSSKPDEKDVETISVYYFNWEKKAKGL